MRIRMQLKWILSICVTEYQAGPGKLLEFLSHCEKIMEHD